MVRVGPSLGWALVVAGVVAAMACGSTEHGPPTASGGANAAGGTGGSLASGADGGGQPSPSGGAGQSGHAGEIPNAGQATGGGATGGSYGGAGAGGLAAGGASPAAGGTGGESEGGAAGAPSCDSGCTKESSSVFCKQDETTWVCSSTYDSVFMRASCRDAATNAIRYCCSSTFMARCQ